MANNPEPPPLDPNVNEAARYYQAFMEEIKVRLDWISHTMDFLRDNKDRPDAFMFAESAFLQFRLCCELLTLAMLAAHRPYGLSDSLMTSWNAELALLELSKMNPQAFPKHAILEHTENGANINISAQGHLTKRGLVRHYKKCARALHRGHLRHALENNTKVYDLIALERWSIRLGKLLSHHVLMILNEGLVLVVHLTGGPNGAVNVAISQAEGPGVLVEHEDGELSVFAAGQKPPAE